jgi:hypothetical protein
VLCAVPMIQQRVFARAWLSLTYSARAAAARC